MAFDPVTGEWVPDPDPPPAREVDPTLVHNPRTGGPGLPDQPLLVVSPDGWRGAVPARDWEKLSAMGFRLEGEDETRERVLEREYGDSPITAGLEGVARSATGGLSDAILSEWAGEGTRERRERNPGAALVGEIGGAVLPIGYGGLATRAGVGVAAKLGAKTFAGRVGAGAVRGATEGAIFGAGQGVSELALDERPVTAERILSVMPSAVLSGAGFGAVAGGAGQLLAEGARAARASAGRVAQKMAGEADSAATAAKVPDHLANMDRPALRVAREAEEGRVLDLARRDGETVIDDLKRYTAGTSKTFISTVDGTQIGGLGKLKGNIMRSLNDPRGWLTRSGRTDFTAGLLRQQEDALVGALGNTAKPLSSKSRPIAEDWLAQNRAAQTRLKSFTDAVAKPTSPLLTEIDDAVASFSDRAAAAREAAKPGLMERLTKASGGGALAGAGMAAGLPPTAAFFLGNAAAEAGVDAILRRFGNKLAKGAKASREGMISGVDRFLGVAEKGIRAATPAVTKTLMAVSYATPEQVAAKRDRPTAKTGNPRVKAYRERAAELRAVTEIAPDGKARMSMPAMRDVTERLAGVAAVAPMVADGLVMAHARRVEFLASKLPLRPGSPEMPVGPDRWQPSEMEIAKFARYAEAAENPDAILDRMSSGKMTPEDAEALQQVYPEIYGEAQDAIMERLPKLRETLPYQKRLMLSIFFDRPVDPAMDPAVMGLLQDNFANEPGTEGGTQSPPADFSSLRGNNAPQPTPAQKSGG